MNCALAISVTLGLGMATVLGGCQPTQENGNRPPLVPTDRARETEIGHLFDRAGHAKPESWVPAAQEIAKLDARGLGAVAALWGVRSRDPELAYRLGSALERRAEELVFAGSGGLPPEAELAATHALDWLRRSLAGIDPQVDYVDAASIRLTMAQAHIVLGRMTEALELLSNRLDTRPLPAELEAEYEAALTVLSGAAK